ncbi:MAG: hypothetical protein ACI35O_12770 [Bacillaceae bacterium]
MSVETETAPLRKLLDNLEQEEQVESLNYLVNKLPEFTKALQSLEEPLLFATSILQDKTTMSNAVRNVEEKWEQLHIGPEHMEALVSMLHMLPRIMPMLQKIEETALFVQEVLQDKQSIGYLMKGVEELPPVSVGIDVVKETNKRFSTQQEFANVSVFRLLKLLKDPTVKKGFHYLEVLLQVVNEKNRGN